MSQHWRRQLDWLHSWGGLLTGWALYFMFVTGTLGYLDTEIDRWMQPELPTPVVTPVALQLSHAQAYLQRHAPQAQSWRVFTAIDRNQPWLKVQWRSRTGDPYRSQLLATQDGGALQARASGGGNALYRLHYRFHYLSRSSARWLASLFAAALLLALLSGLFIHRHLLRDWFTYRPHKRLRSGLDLHLLLGVALLPFLLMISYSGLLFYLPHHYPAYANQKLNSQAPAASLRQLLKPPRDVVPQANVTAALTLPTVAQFLAHQLTADQIRRIDLERIPGRADRAWVYPRTQALQRQEKPLQIIAGNDGPQQVPYQPHQGARAFYEALLGIHEGTFARPPLRLAYLLCGLLGTLAIASGLLIWEIKRIKRLAGQRGHRLVCALNLAVLVGLPLAIGMYFSANRLLPLQLAGRAEWEMHALFASWALTLLYACWRGRQRGWIEICGLTGLVYLSLPLLSIVTTENHAWRAWQQQDSTLWGFELGTLLFGLCALLLAFWLHKRWYSA